MRLIALALLISVRAWAALSSAAAFEVRPTNGLDTNGGCFIAGASGTDFSQQNAAQYGFADLASSNGTTNPSVVSSASHSFAAADVGNCINVSAGTNWTAGIYQIVSVASGNATLDRAAGSVASLTAGTYAVGGAIQTLSKLNSSMAQGNVAWVKAESTISMAAVLTINFAGATTNQFPAIQGYTAARGDNGQVTLQSTAINLNGVVVISSVGLTLSNFIVDCNNQTSSGGIVFNAAETRAVNVLVKNCTGSGGNGIAFKFQSNHMSCVYCTATSISGATSAFQFLNNGSSLCYYCVAVGNSVPGFSGASAISEQVCIRCISANNSGAASDGFVTAANQGSIMFLHCVAYGNGRDGFRITSAAVGHMQALNNVAYGNGGVGLDYTNGSLPTGVQLFDYNAYRANTGGNLTNVPAGTHDVTLSADPFVNGAANNFALNSTAGGGGSLKAAGFPGTLAMGGTGFLAIGALQPQGGGGQVGFPIVQ